MQHPDTPTIDDLLAHSGWVRGLSRHLLGSESDADDLVQETWLAALVGRSRRAARPADPRRWLGRVLRNRAASAFGSGERRRVREELASRPEALPSPAELVERADLSRALVRHVLALPEESRTLLLLRYYEDLSSAEIARRLGRPSATVRTQVARALEQLRLRLDATGDESDWRAAFATAATPLAKSSAVTLAASATTLAGAAAAVLAVAGGLWWYLQRGGPPDVVPPTIVAAEEPPEPTPGDAPAPATSRDDASTSATATRTPVDPVAEAPPVAGPPVRGVLVDEASEAPVPWYEFGVARTYEEAERGEVVLAGRTDAEGAFRLEPGLPEGRLWFVRLEDRRRAETELRGFFAPPAPAPLEFEHATGDPAALSIEVGPAFELDCPDLADASRPAAAVFAGAEWTPEHGGRLTHVVVGDPTFVRFAPFESPGARTNAKRLCVATLDGRWAGYAPVDLPEGTRMPRVALALEPAASLEVHVDYGRGMPATMTGGGVWAGAHETEADLQGQELYWFGGYSDSSPGGVDRLYVHFMPVGTATFHMGTEHYTPCVDVLDLRQGWQTHVARCERLVFGDGKITGTLRSTFGRPEVDVEAYLTRVAGGGGTLRTLALEFVERDGEWIAEFELDRLSHELHELAIAERGVAGFGGLEVVPRSLELLPDGPPAEFVWFQEGETRRLTVKAVDVTTGERVKSFRSRVALPEGVASPVPVATVEGRTRHRLSGDLVDGQVQVDAPGYRPARAPLPEPLPEKGGTVKVELQPGWGGFLRARVGEEPAIGARVLADDVEVGVTDDEGRLELALDARPERLWLELDGHRVGRARGTYDDGRLVEMEYVHFWEFFDFALDPVR